MKVLKSRVVLRMIRAALDSSCWQRCKVRPSSICPSEWRHTFTPQTHTFNYTFNWPIKFLSCTSHTSSLRFHTKTELNEYRHNWQHYTAAGLWGCMFACDSLVVLEDPVELIWRQAPDRTATGPSPRASQSTENLRIWSPPHPSPQHHASRCSPAFPEQTQERKNVSVNYIIKIKMQSLLWLQVKNKKKQNDR